MFKNLTIENILKWLASTGITLVGALFLAMRWYGDYKVTNKAIADTLSIIYRDNKVTQQTLNEFIFYKSQTDGRLNVIEGTQDATTKSYIRTLQNQLKDKDEIILYQKEINEALKKNEKN
jgi:hypothetical protein